MTRSYVSGDTWLSVGSAIQVQAPEVAWSGPGVNRGGSSCGGENAHGLVLLLVSVLKAAKLGIIACITQSERQKTMNAGEILNHLQTQAWLDRLRPGRARG
jgi:hypothetical protein